MFDKYTLDQVKPPHSIFRYVKKLQPGHCLEIKAKKTAIEKWYNLPYLPGSNGASTLSYPDQCTQLECLLEDAVRLRLIADVPLGAFLSGGIDSSVIVALAKRHTPNLNTFSIGFQDEGYFDVDPLFCFLTFVIEQLNNSPINRNKKDLLIFI